MQGSNSVNTKRDIWISKTLSWILRHGAIKEGLHLSSDGYISVVHLLNCDSLKSKCTTDDIRRIVATNNKQRFTLRTSENGILEIKANQGHSIGAVSDLELTLINDPTKVQNVIHGTYFKFWNLIKRQGLYRGKRNHIHFSAALPGDSDVSGIRKSAEIYVYINLVKTLAAGLLFYLSPNNVILCSGDNDGYIKPEYFLKVYRASDFTELSF